MAKTMPFLERYGNKMEERHWIVTAGAASLLNEIFQSCLYLRAIFSQKTAQFNVIV
jgi:hypothetical protein